MMDFINTDNYRDQQLHNYLDSLREEKDTDDEEIEEEDNELSDY